MKRVPAEEFEDVIDDMLAEGWTIENREEVRVILIKRQYGSVIGHIIVFILTFWFTLGIGNALYFAYKYFLDSEREVIRMESTAQTGGTASSLVEQPDKRSIETTDTEPEAQKKPIGGENRPPDPNQHTVRRAADLEIGDEILINSEISAVVDDRLEAEGAIQYQLSDQTGGDLPYMLYVATKSDGGYETEDEGAQSVAVQDFTGEGAEFYSVESLEVASDVVADESKNDEDEDGGASLF